MSALDIKLAKQAQSALAVAIQICRNVPATAHERILPEYAVPAMKSIGRLVNWQSETVHGFEDIHQANQALIKAIFEAENGAAQRTIEGEPFDSLLTELIVKHRFGGDRGKAHAALVAHIDSFLQATPVSPASAQPVYQWRRRSKVGKQDPWHDAPYDEAYARVDEHYEARTLYAAPEPVSQPVVAVPEGLTFDGYHDSDEHYGKTILELVRSRLETDPDDLAEGDVFYVDACWTQPQEWRVVRSGNPFEVERVSPPATPLAAPVERGAVHWDLFPAYLVDHCEREVIYEESIQHWIAAMLKDEDYLRISAERAAAPVEQDKQDTLMPERIEAIQALGRDDPAVHAFLTLQRRDSLAWGDVLAQMVLHLAQDKAALTAQLMRQAVGSVASNADGVIRVNWMRPERVEAGTLLYCATEAVQPDAAMGSLFYSLRALTDWAEAAAVKIEGEFGFGRSLEEIIAAGDLAEEITNARTLLDGPAATPALIDPYEAVYCDLRGCEPHGLSVCDDFKQWKHDLFAIPALPNAKDVFLTFKGKLIAGYGMHIVSNDDGTLTVRPRATPALLGLTDAEIYEIYRSHGSTPISFARAIIAALKEAS